MRKRLIIVLAMLCLCAISAMGQKKVFNTALKNGPGPDGYYHADFSNNLETLASASEYAYNHGYVIRNPIFKREKNKDGYYTSLVGLDFIPVENYSTDNRVANLIYDFAYAYGASGGEDMFSCIRKTRYMGAPLDVVAAARYLNCFVYYSRFGKDSSGSQIVTYSFITEKCLEDMLVSQFLPGSSFRSTGRSLFYTTGKNGGTGTDGSFKEFNDFRWTGQTVSGALDGNGVAYRYYATDDGQSSGNWLNVIVGDIKNGGPFGSADYYTLYINDLISKKIPKPTKVVMDDSDPAGRLCFINGRHSVIDSSYRTSLTAEEKLGNLDRFTGSNGAWSNNKTEIIKGLTDGYFTLRRKINHIDYVDFTVDKDGQTVSLTEDTKTRYLEYLEKALDKVISDYDNYVSKVFNPQDVLQADAVLRKKYGIGLFVDISSHIPKDLTYYAPELLQPLYNDFCSKNEDKLEKAKMSENAVDLMWLCHRLATEDKDKIRSRTLEKASTMNSKSLFRDARLEDGGIEADEYERNRLLANNYFDNIKNNRYKPGDLNETRTVIETELRKHINWWAGVYSEAYDILKGIIDYEKAERHIRSDDPNDILNSIVSKSFWKSDGNGDMVMVVKFKDSKEVSVYFRPGREPYECSYFVPSKILGISWYPTLDEAIVAAYRKY